MLSCQWEEQADLVKHALRPTFRLRSYVTSQTGFYLKPGRIYGQAILGSKHDSNGRLWGRLQTALGATCLGQEPFEATK